MGLAQLGLGQVPGHARLFIAIHLISSRSSSRTPTTTSPTVVPLSLSLSCFHHPVSITCLTTRIHATITACSFILSPTIMSNACLNYGGSVWNWSAGSWGSPVWLGFSRPASLSGSVRLGLPAWACLPAWAKNCLGSPACLPGGKGE